MPIEKHKLVGINQQSMSDVFWIICYAYLSKKDKLYLTNSSQSTCTWTRGQEDIATKIWTSYLLSVMKPEDLWAEANWQWTWSVKRQTILQNHCCAQDIVCGQPQTAQAVVPGVPWTGIWSRHGNAVLGKIIAGFKWSLRENGKSQKTWRYSFLFIRLFQKI